LTYTNVTNVWSRNILTVLIPCTCMSLLTQLIYFTLNKISKFYMYSVYRDSKNPNWLAVHTIHYILLFFIVGRQIQLQNWLVSNLAHYLTIILFAEGEVINCHIITGHLTNHISVRKSIFKSKITLNSDIKVLSIFQYLC